MCTPKIYIFLLYCITDCLIYFFTIFNRNIYNFIFLNQLFCITRNTNLLSVTSSSYRKREIVIFVNFGELKDLYTSERSGMCSVFFMVCWRYVFVGYKWNSLILVSRKCCAKVGFLDIFFLTQEFNSFDVRYQVFIFRLLIWDARWGVWFNFFLLHSGKNF